VFVSALFYASIIINREELEETENSTTNAKKRGKIGNMQERRKQYRSASERFRDNRQDVRRVTIANHNSDRKTRMTG